VIPKPHVVRYFLIKLIARETFCFPKRVENGMDVFPRISQLWRGDIAKRLRWLFGLVMTAYIVPASVTLPKRQGVQIATVRVNLNPACKPSLNLFPAAPCAPN
jgi:hypothetical protein